MVRGRSWSPPRTGNYAKYIESNFIPGYTQIESIHARLDALDEAGLIYWSKNRKEPQLKRYLAAHIGRALQDLILGINSIRGKECTGYPTQKPLALLERIIKASSNPGDVVLDPFCGTATTCVAAERLGRQWIGIDISADAETIIKLRLDDEVEKKRKENDKNRLDPENSEWMRSFDPLADVTIETDPPSRTDSDAVPTIKSPHYTNHKSALFGEQEGRCNGCRRDYWYKDFSVDHIDPNSPDRDRKSNLQLLCFNCNSTKGDRPMSYLIERLQERNLIDQQENPINPII